jgi:hypothetical protein
MSLHLIDVCFFGEKVLLDASHYVREDVADGWAE